MTHLEKSVQYDYLYEALYKGLKSLERVMIYMTTVGSYDYTFFPFLRLLSLPCFSVFLPSSISYFSLSLPYIPSPTFAPPFRFVCFREGWRGVLFSHFPSPQCPLSSFFFAVILFLCSVLSLSFSFSVPPLFPSLSISLTLSLSLSLNPSSFFSSLFLTELASL